MKIEIPYGRSALPLEVPDNATIIAAPPADALPDPKEAVARALHEPIGSPPLCKIVAKKNPSKTCILVSDITRPVPNSAILPPLLRELEQAGINSADITILIATGMHRESTPAERQEVLGSEIAESYRVIDHISTDAASLVKLDGRTSSGTEVSINRIYYEADIKIITGLIEPHFMAGYSGGRKSVCPGIVNLSTIQKFHGPGFLENPLADNCVLDGNPCHQESLEVAQTAGVDFMINVALDHEKRIIGVFAGDLEKAHLYGIQSVEPYVRCQIDDPADIVVTSGGAYPLDTTFYQTVKCMVAALPAVKEGGTIIVASECSEGIGSPEYEEILFQYDRRPEEFIEDIKKSPEVRKDQWELEMQCRVLRKVGVEGLVCVIDGISGEKLSRLTVTPFHDFTTSTQPATALQETFDKIASAANSPKVTVMPSGPYVIPFH